MATAVINPDPFGLGTPIVPVQEELIKAAVLQDTYSAAPGDSRVLSIEIQRNIRSSSLEPSDEHDGGAEVISKEMDSPFKVVTHFTSTANTTSEESGNRGCYYAANAEAALKIYEDLYKRNTTGTDAAMKPVPLIDTCRWVGSKALRKTLLYRETYTPTQKPSAEVALLADNVWKEAMGKLQENLSLPVESILPGQVAKAEAVLQQIWRILMNDTDGNFEQIQELETVFFDLVPHQEGMRSSLLTKGRVATKMDLCQMIRDVVNVSEETGWDLRPTAEAKYRALRCRIQYLAPGHPEHEKVKKLVLSTVPREMIISTLRIYAVSRPPEEENYAHEIGNDTLLFHASKPTNVLGILSRGLLMPRVVVEKFDGSRRDEGLLGSGLYFGDRTSTCIQYCRNGYFSNTRMMVVNKVAIGKVKEFYEIDMSLQKAPDGYDSTHGVRANENQASEFTEDEYVVYSTRQQCIRYLVEFAIAGDDDSMRADSFGYGNDSEDNEDNDENNKGVEEMTDIDLLDIQSCQDPVSKTATGLISGDSTHSVTLREVHVRGNVIDLAAKITVMQVYDNESTNTNIQEARYVFPLDEKAAVCAFEAYINGKHVVGEVKTKERATAIFQEAVREGHGAYLMEEEASNVFSVSIGNLPPKATVVIKITYVTELGIEDDKVMFNLLGSVAPWLREEIRGKKLSEQKQLVAGVGLGQNDRKESLQVSIKMSSDITEVESPTHAIKVKRKGCDSTATLQDGVKLGDGFQLLIGVTEPHRSRMWTEYDPREKTHANMVVFYPEIPFRRIDDPEVVLLLDWSTSMKGNPKEDARKLCLMILKSLPPRSRFNVITFSTDFMELFPALESNGPSEIQRAVEFVQRSLPLGGSSEAWRPLRSLSLLPSSKSVRNVILVSDGHLANEKLTLNIAAQYKHVNRIFTLCVSSTGNHHIMRAIADVSGGAFEMFGRKSKSKWEGKIEALTERCCQPSVNCVGMQWRTADVSGDGEPFATKKLIQVPAQVSSIFTGSQLLVFALGPKLDEVILSAEIAGNTITERITNTADEVSESLTLHRLAARALVREWEIGSFDRDQVMHEARTYDLETYLIDLSIRLSIITPLTSFVAVEKRDEKEEMKDGPNIADLLATVTTDAISSAEWCEVYPDEEEPTESRLEKLLKQASKSQKNYSYASAEKYYMSALNMAKQNMSDVHHLFRKCCLAMSKFTLKIKGDAERALEWLKPAELGLLEVADERESMARHVDKQAQDFSEVLHRVLTEVVPSDGSVEVSRMPDVRFEITTAISRLKSPAVDISVDLEQHDQRLSRIVVDKAVLREKKKRFKLPSFFVKKRADQPLDPTSSAAMIPTPKLKASALLAAQFDEREQSSEAPRDTGYDSMGLEALEMRSRELSLQSKQFEKATKKSASRFQFRFKPHKQEKKRKSAKPFQLMFAEKHKESKPHPATPLPLKQSKQPPPSSSFKSALPATPDTSKPFARSMTRRAPPGYSARSKPFLGPTPPPAPPPPPPPPPAPAPPPPPAHVISQGVPPIAPSTASKLARHSPPRSPPPCLYGALPYASSSLCLQRTLEMRADVLLDEEDDDDYEYLFDDEESKQTLPATPDTSKPLPRSMTPLAPPASSAPSKSLRALEMRADVPSDEEDDDDYEYLFDDEEEVMQLDAVSSDLSSMERDRTRQPVSSIRVKEPDYTSDKVKLIVSMQNQDGFWEFEDSENLLGVKSKIILTYLSTLQVPQLILIRLVTTLLTLVYLRHVLLKMEDSGNTSSGFNDDESIIGGIRESLSKAQAWIGKQDDKLVKEVNDVVDLSVE